MRRTVITLVIIFAAGLLCGMGGLGGKPEGTLPETEQNFSVTIVDRSGVTVNLSRFSMDGSTFLHGQLGDASVTIPFEDILKARFTAMANERITVDLVLVDDKELTLKIRSRSGFAGKMEVGVFHIRAEDGARIEFK